ncbi:MAG TPA: sulfite exporter TauE/SafE family protein [Acidisarcina sp.]|nr:sulfite exporter TauE/SafE family protein [Acidisarcina sp.]
MEYAIGFLIAFVIAVTGVGAGSITAPLLIFFLHVPVAVGVGTALAYSAIVKFLLVPIQMWRRQVNYRIVGFMLLGGLPGVILGSILFRYFDLKGQQNVLYVVLGLIITASSGWHLYRHFRPVDRETKQKDRPRSLAALMLPVGFEVGFSSSGAGALGTIALLGLTSLTTAQVVGTDLAFGFCVSLIGSSMHILHSSYGTALLIKLVCGGMVGALSGSLLAPRLPNRQLRLALSAWLLILGLQFCYKAVTNEVGSRPIPSAISAPSMRPIPASIHVR